MQKLLLALVALGGAIVGLVSGSMAAQDLNGKVRASGVELVVYEHAECQYCRIFRADILPRYQGSTQAGKAPLRFVNVEHTGTHGVGALNGEITMVPTFVLMKDGREVDRIVGYWAPDNFFKMVAYMLLKSE